MSKVSVIIPAFNKYNLTRKTIVSIINQTYKKMREKENNLRTYTFFAHYFFTRLSKKVT